MLSTSFLKASYVQSKPTGYTNLAISAAFLSNRGSAARPPAISTSNVDQSGGQGAQGGSVSYVGQNKSAAQMLAERDMQAYGYSTQNSAPLRVKN